MIETIRSMLFVAGTCAAGKPEGKGWIWSSVSALLVTVELIASAATAADNSYSDASGKFAGSYLCTPEARGGVSFDEASGTWKATTFKKGEPIIIRLKTAGTSTETDFGGKRGTVMRYEVTVEEMGSNKPLGCGYPTLTILKNGECQCNTMDLEILKLSLAHMRYRTAYLQGRNCDVG